MPLILSIDSESAKLELSDTTIVNYKLDYAQPSNNVAKGHADMIRLTVTIDVMEVLSLEGSFEDNLNTVHELRDWGEYVYTNDNSYEKYYRKVTLKNYFGDEEIRTLELSHALVSKSRESIDPLRGKHTIRLELLQKEDKHRYVTGIGSFETEGSMPTLAAQNSATWIVKVIRSRHTITGFFAHNQMSGHSSNGDFASNQAMLRWIGGF